MKRLLAAVLVTGCATDSIDDLPADPADMDQVAGEEQLPPQGNSAGCHGGAPRDNVFTQVR